MLAEADEGEHGGLGIAPASHGTFSWSADISGLLYRGACISPPSGPAAKAA